MEIKGQFVPDNILRRNPLQAKHFRHLWQQIWVSISRTYHGLSFKPNCGQNLSNGSCEAHLSIRTLDNLSSHPHDLLFIPAPKSIIHIGLLLELLGSLGINHLSLISCNLLSQLQLYWGRRISHTNHFMPIHIPIIFLLELPHHQPHKELLRTSLHAVIGLADIVDDSLFKGSPGDQDRDEVVDLIGTYSI